MLTAYTIAIVQNAQVLQYDQMHVVLKTARNQASLEMPLRVEELMTAHFNLAVLANETDINKTPDAQKPEATTLDTEPSASAANEQTYLKIPSHRYVENCNSKKQHPTGAVTPTCRREYGLVNGIPAGYESDDSWDNDSHTHEHTHMHNIVPLLALRTWNNRPHRGCEQLPRQNNNINVQTGHAPYQRPWDNNRTEGAPAANKLFVPEPTARYNAGIQYSRLLHRRCTTLDLETTFKEIKISQNIEKEVCKQCQAEFCRCPAFTPGTLCSSVSSMPTNISDKQIPNLVVNKPLQQLHLPVQSPSDEEADREVATISKAPEYYRVRSHVRHR